MSTLRVQLPPGRGLRWPVDAPAYMLPAPAPQGGRRITAPHELVGYHEAAHIVVAEALGARPVEVKAAGWRYYSGLATFNLPDGDPEERAWTRACIYAAGKVGQEMAAAWLAPIGRAPECVNRLTAADARPADAVPPREPVPGQPAHASDDVLIERLAYRWAPNKDASLYRSAARGVARDVLKLRWGPTHALARAILRFGVVSGAAAQRVIAEAPFMRYEPTTR